MRRREMKIGRRHRVCTAGPMVRFAVMSVALALAVGVPAQDSPAAPPVSPAAQPELPAYLEPPSPPAPPPPVRPRPLPVRPSVRPATPPQRAATPVSSRAAVQPFPLVFNAEVQEVTADPGATNVTFHFQFTNSSPEQVAVQRVHTSCGCTTAQLPDMPWVIEAAGEGSFDVTMDVRGKRSQVSKLVYLYTDKGFKSLTVRAVIPDDASLPSSERLRNLQIAAADRQAVFRGDCARCHAEPAKGKKARALYQAVCAVCHEAEHRADMVPDLRRLDPKPDEEGWRRWVTHGKDKTLMPAFAESEGGPLTPEQIDSLVEYLPQRFPQRPASTVRQPSASSRPAP